MEDYNIQFVDKIGHEYDWSYFKYICSIYTNYNDMRGDVYTTDEGGLIVQYGPNDQYCSTPLCVISQQLKLKQSMFFTELYKFLESYKLIPVNILNKVARDLHRFDKVDTICQLYRCADGYGTVSITKNRKKYIRITNQEEHYI